MLTSDENVTFITKNIMKMSVRPFFISQSDPTMGLLSTVAMMDVVVPFLTMLVTLGSRKGHISFTST